MKKILSLGLLTVCALVLTERPAHAWVNSKFSVGLSWHLQSGNNNVLWGLWKNGQVPGPEAYQGPFHYGPPPFSAPGMSQPTGVFPWYGYAPPNETAPPPLGQNAHYGQPNPYQTVSYQQNGYYYPSYFYPTYQAYAYQAPPYWYQGR